MSKMIMFHGEECPHCQAMQPIVDKLIAEGANIEKLEVWHNEENNHKMNQYADIIAPACGGSMGVPCFLDIEGKRAICGERSYEDLKNWIV